MRILFPNYPLEPKHPDASFESEYNAAQEAGLDVGLLGLEAYFGSEITFHQVPPGTEDVLYRGWILKPEDYSRMYLTLLGLEKHLSTNPEEYLHCYYFPHWYEAIGGVSVTPRSFWLQGVGVNDVETIAYQAKDRFSHCGVIIKDFVKSRKHEWHDACYIPNTLDEDNVRRVIRNFLDRQGDTLVGGLVLREFVPLKQIGIHSKSRLPLVNEHRFFVYRGTPFYQAPYWSEGDYSGNYPDVRAIEDILPKVKSPFYAIDVAEKEEGGWIIVELNDGGSAGIPDGGTPQDFYQALVRLHFKE